jgi:hypothetical protein
MATIIVNNDNTLLTITPTDPGVISVDAQITNQIVEVNTQFTGTGIPGQPGANGSSGTSGITGSSGSSGTSGATGASGSSGTSGATGASGSSGTSGATGASGSSGTSGATGSSGTSGATGASGSSGTSGATGASGSSGTSGASGSSGTSGETGASGSSGTSGATGASGSSGTSGATGASGTSGATGSSGTSGATGSSGTSGATGATGSSGTSGATGASGSSGTSGATGAAGTAGTAGTGFNTISNAGANRILLSDGSANAATASSNLSYTNSAFIVNGNTIITGSLTVTGSSMLFPAVDQMILTGSMLITGSSQLTGSFTLRRSPLVDSIGLDLYGTGTKGGNKYFDFMRVTNTTGSATTPSKTIRLNEFGDIEIINHAYNTLLFILNDSGSLALPGTTGGSLSGFKNTGGGVSINSGKTVIFDDGNTHIHSTTPDSNLWINASGSGNIVINGQTGASGGVLIGTSTRQGFVTISGSVNYSTPSAYYYLNGTGTGGPISPNSASFSLVTNQRIAATEFDAYSDERLKNIIEYVSTDEAKKFVLDVDPIKFTWKSSEDNAIKVGYSAQEVIKAGFNNLVGVLPNETLGEYVDSDGFVSPSGSQLTVSYEQIIPYHSVLIKHLLIKIEELETQISELKSR